MSCICLCKDTNFKANHNELINTIFEQNVVYAYAKILILKQITTFEKCRQFYELLYMPMQRY